jgi:protein-tyrosine phosphatase
MLNILFVCSANRFRSVIAAECFRTLAGQHQQDVNLNISSAGTWAKDGLPPIPQALRYAKSRGLNIEDVRSREIKGPMLEESDLVVVMSEGQRESILIEFPHVDGRISLLSEVCEGLTYEIPDLVEKIDETPEELGDEICSLVTNGFEGIIKAALQNQRKRN